MSRFYVDFLIVRIRQWRVLLCFICFDNIYIIMFRTRLQKRRSEFKKVEKGKIKIFFQVVFVQFQTIIKVFVYFIFVRGRDESELFRYRISSLKFLRWEEYFGYCRGFHFKWGIQSFLFQKKKEEDEVFSGREIYTVRVFRFFFQVRVLLEAVVAMF